MTDETDCPAPDWGNQGDISAQSDTAVCDRAPVNPKVEKARILREQGLSWPEISSHTGISEGALRVRASRERWIVLPSKPRVQPKLAVTPIVTPTTVTSQATVTPLQCYKDIAESAVEKAVEDAAAQHVALFSGIIPKVGRELDRRISTNPGGIPAKELLQLVQASEIADKVGRRALGLDSTEGRVTIGLICSGVMQLPSKEKPAIEVESKSS